MGVLLITRFTFLEALRRRLFLAVLSLSLLLLILFTLFLHVLIASSTSQSSASDFTTQFLLLASGMFISIPSIWMVYLLSGIMVIFLTAGMISSEIEAGTFAIIVPKPLHRFEIVLGKWLGYALLLGGYLAFLYFAFLGIIYWLTGYWPEQPWSALGALELSVLALLGLTTLGSTLFPTLVNGAIMLILFISAPLTNFISTFLQLTATSRVAALPPPSDAVQNIITVTNLILPADALWHQASYSLLPLDVLNLLGTQNISAQAFNIPLLNPQAMTGALFLWIICYCLVTPVLAMWRFSRRNL
jgi:ABC-type transport system involved in multi-copper enzyme maturation permease subunit